MLDYDWGNPSTIMLTGNQGGAATEPDQTHRQIFDQNYTFLPEPEQFLSQPQHGPIPTTTTTTTTITDFSHYHHFNPAHPQLHHPFFDPRAFPGASSTSFSTLHPSMLSLDSLPHVNATHSGPGPGPGPGLGLMLLPKSEDAGRPMDFAGSGLGLNLGGRTYFSSSEDNFVNRLYRRSKMVEPGSTASSSSNSPRCQAQGCNADLSGAKHYHRRHKVCEFHSKAATVIAAGLTQRFCQQCSRLHSSLVVLFWMTRMPLGTCPWLPMIGCKLLEWSQGIFVRKKFPSHLFLLLYVLWLIW